MWSFESKGVSRLSASIGLMTWRYGSNGAIRSTGLRGLEACLQRGHQILRGLRLDLGDRGQVLALDLRLAERHQRVAEAVSELRRIELRRECLDELEREGNLRAGQHDGARGGRPWGRAHFVVERQRGEYEDPVVV